MYTFLVSSDRHAFELCTADEWVHGPTLKLAINNLLKFDFRLKTHRTKALNIITALTPVTVSLTVRFPAQGLYANITRQPWLNRLHKLRIILAENREAKYRRTLQQLNTLIIDLCNVANDISSYCDRNTFENTCHWNYSHGRVDICG